MVIDIQLIKINIWIILLSTVCLAQDSLLYSNPKFSVYKSSVTEGEAEARVLNDGSIVSSYSKAFEGEFDRTVIFKFSVNGLDNEKAPGEDYRFYLGQPSQNISTPVYSFGKPDIMAQNLLTEQYSIKPGDNWKVTFRLDMRGVLDALVKSGVYTFYNNSVIRKEDFTGVYIMGNKEPLNWDFPGPSKNEKYKLTDPDGDGIYEITLEFSYTSHRAPAGDGYYKWSNSGLLKDFPGFSSDIPLLNSLYILSAEEFYENFRDDGALMAGAKWTGVWTRDISYSILLSLAVVAPDACKTSLMAKVKDGKIIQDTGTGGSWPVSSDRMVWALAAYEVYLSTGDKEWLKGCFEIIKNSIAADEVTLIDEPTGLVRGESSFLDWREQTYPRWMEPVDIYKSLSLGTNAVFAQTYRILDEMSVLLGEQYSVYRTNYKNLCAAINTHLWLEEKGYYSQFIYGRNYQSKSSGSETLGEALTILFDIAGERSNSVLTNTPTSFYGTPVVSPQSREVPPYHNNGVWPFVEAYKMWAAKQTGQEDLMLHSMASIIRAATLFLTNKENFVAETGDPNGTEINSDRQLWSVAGNLAMFYRVLFGIELSPGQVNFAPHIPVSFEGTYKLTNLKIGKAEFDISVSGKGNRIKSYLLNGKSHSGFPFTTDVKAAYNIEIVLEPGNTAEIQTIHPVMFAPAPPEVLYDNLYLKWAKINQVERYHIYRNGELIASSSENSYPIQVKLEISEYQVSSVSVDGIESFLSAPVRIGAGIQEFKFHNLLQTSTEYFEPEMLQNGGTEIQVHVLKGGWYTVDFLYANGSGPINTDNKCAVRSLDINGKFTGSIVMPQRGTGDWTSKGYSNSSKAILAQGNNTFRIYYAKHNQNMNGQENKAHIYTIRLTLLEEE